MDIFKKEMLRIMTEEIEPKMTELHSENITDEEYQELWNEINEHYQWFLIRMEQWLNDVHCHVPEEVYEINIKAQDIGQKTGYYWNKISKGLFQAVKDGAIY